MEIISKSTFPLRTLGYDEPCIYFNGTGCISDAPEHLSSIGVTTHRGPGIAQIGILLIMHLHLSKDSALIEGLFLHVNGLLSPVYNH